MATRNSGEPRRSSQRIGLRARFFVASFPVFLIALAMLMGGCASPGQPSARTPAVPEAVSNLSATQEGNHVLLAFDIPKSSTGGRPLEHPPTIEVFRDFESASISGASQPKSPKHPALLVTIPSELTPRYVEQGQFRYSEPLEASDFTDHPNSVAVYSVRTRISDKKPSANSNLAVLHIYPAPERITDLAGKVTPTAVVLRWTPPRKTPIGPAPPLAGYQIYRGEAQSNPVASAENAANAAGTPSTPPGAASLPGIPSSLPELQNPLVKIGESISPRFSDTHAKFDKTYVYSVQSLLDYSGTNVESSHSNFLAITPRDTFPPAAPEGLVAIYVPAAGGVPAYVDLSWTVSPEADLAGYQIYRREQANGLGTRMNKQLLLTPAFRDMNVASGRRYYYAVTAVDRSGNESAPSAAVSVNVPAVTQPSHD
ncbi:MAG: fibronectin type III domain-containing protein [Candidatus Acidiferrales bacterium]